MLNHKNDLSLKECFLPEGRGHEFKSATGVRVKSAIFLDVKHSFLQVFFLRETKTQNRQHGDKLKSARCTRYTFFY